MIDVRCLTSLILKLLISTVSLSKVATGVAKVLLTFGSNHFVSCVGLERLFTGVHMPVLGALMSVGLELLQLIDQILIFPENKLIELSDLL